MCSFNDSAPQTVITTSARLVTLLLLICATTSSSWKQKWGGGGGYPVILIPGDGGSQLEAKLDKPSVVHYICNKKTNDFFDLWLNMELLVPLVLDCWVDNMRLVYNSTTRTTENSPGVQIRIPGFGNTSTVDWLDPSQLALTAYFNSITDVLVKQGYQRGLTIRGAPYDFRKAPNEHSEYFVNFKVMVEETFQKIGKPVVLVAHSMGNPFMLHFLNLQDQAWKDQHVRALVTLAGVWGGAVKALRVFASGDNLGVMVLNAHKLRGEQRTSPSLAFLLPSDKFWSADEVLVQTDSKNYTMANYSQFFTDINYETGYEMWKDTKDIIYSLTPPGVEVHCLHGVNVSTDQMIIYTDKNFPDGPPKIISGDGDGTVNFRSLVGCLSWRSKQKQPVYHQTFPNVDHMSILTHPPVLDYIAKVVMSL